MSSKQVMFSSFRELGAYLQREGICGQEAEVHTPDPVIQEKEPRAFWPDGSPITRVIVKDHVISRYRMRNFDAGDEITDDAIMDKIITGIMQGVRFDRRLPGDNVWVVSFGGEYMAAARDKDGSMIVVSYYGTRTQMVWHYRQEVQIRETRKVMAAV